VFVYPDLDEAIQIEIRDEIWRSRPSAPAAPEGSSQQTRARCASSTSRAESWSLSVGAQPEQNKSTPMKMRGKLYEKEEQEKAAKMGDVHAQKKDRMGVADSLLRARPIACDRPPSDLKVSNVDAVLDGSSINSSTPI